MISVLLLFFGTTLTYTGILVLWRDTGAGLALLAAGILLVTKPAFEAFRYLWSHFGPTFHTIEQSGHKRKDHLRLVRSDEDKPTIH